MKIHIITIFPESFEGFLKTSILKNSIDKNLIEINIYKLNDFSIKPSKRVDSKAYWTHGQVISAIPLQKAIFHVFDKVWKNIPIIYFTPSWDLLNQEKILDYYEKLKENDFIIICWHYEWIDQRIIDLYVDYKVSIWEYILTSWELASQIFIDWLNRLMPWVLWNKLSYEEESFSKKLNWKKEYPHYTRPEVFEWLKVPDILISWNHKEIEKWKFNNLS